MFDITLVASFLAFGVMVAAWLILPADRKEAEATAEIIVAPSTSKA